MPPNPPVLSPAEPDARELKQREQTIAFSQFALTAPTLPELLSGAQKRLFEYFEVERATLFALDTRTNELFSVTGNEFKEIRIPVGVGSIAGFVAVTKRVLNLHDVYDLTELARIDSRLKFDNKWDKASGFRTREVMCLPVLNEANLLGVLQLINHKAPAPFDPREVVFARELARTLGIAFYNLNRLRTLRTTGRKRTRWDALVDGGVITEQALQQALSQAASENKDPARFLVESAGVNRAEVERSATAFFNCEAWRPAEGDQISEPLRARVRPDYLKKLCAAPLERRGKKLLAVIDDPSDLGRTDQLRMIEPECQLQLMVGFRDEIMALIEASFGLRQDVGVILDQLSQETPAPAAPASSGPARAETLSESDSAIVKLANQVISDAWRRGASDIHVEPNGAEQPAVIRFRVDGDCVDYQQVPATHWAPLVARLKIMANLDISERRRPQDGKIRLRLPEGEVELRVVTVPTANGNEDVVLRILAASKPLPLDQMGMSERNYKAFRAAMGSPYGLVLCVGPTGSGKTTTLHSALGSINTRDMKIWTAEDPVEITQPGLRQVQMHPKIGLTFAAAMRTFLRADPDVIMVGEMRDQETASTAVEASLTGHLVLSTLHTNSAPETVTRLLDMGLDPFSFSDSLLAVLAQRLARTLCKKCREQVDATEAEYEELSRTYGQEQFAMKAGPWVPGFKLWRARGCRECGNTGYKGRVGLHELLVTDDAIKAAIAHRAPVGEIRDLAIKGGMTTLLQDGIEKVLSGATDLKQVLSVASR